MEFLFVEGLLLLAYIAVTWYTTEYEIYHLDITEEGFSE